MKKILKIILFLLISLKTFSQDSVKTGIASQYARFFNGRRTATGEIYRSSHLTCASNYFKLNTILKVTNIKTGASVIVRVNDRMHPKMARKGRIVDLSNSAAQLLGFKEGLIKVITEVI